MKHVFRTLILVVFAFYFVSCSKTNKSKSSLTGLSFNDPRSGNYIKGSFEGQTPPPGMVAVEGGTFTMGAVQDDVMFDWNTTPRKMHVRSFYMDEAEVTNSEYFLFVQYIKDVFPPSE